MGKISARVRDKLWEKIICYKKIIAVMIYSYNNDQGFKVRTHGDSFKIIEDYDGYILCKTLNKDK